MKLAANQPYFFPYLGFFQLINAVDKFIIYDNLNYIKGGWINRNSILLRDHKVLMISVPVKHSSSYSKIYEIEIDNTKSTWRKKLLQTLTENYRKSPMFNDVFPILEQAIYYPAEKISELDTYTIVTVCNYLKINTIIESDSNKYRAIENLILDPEYISEKYKDIENKTIRIFELCRMEQAETFYNAIGGEQLYSKELFEKYNINLRFVKSSDIKYKQSRNTFIPNLSIIDVLMFNRIDEIQELLTKYELV